MKSTELRIGNWVLRVDESNSTPVDIGETIYKVCPYSLVTLVNHREYDIEKFKGYPLTEKVLLKFGFEPNGHGGFIKSWHPSKYNDSVVIYLIGRGMNDAGSWSLYDASQNGYPEIKNGLKYVHELQNLWYFLTRNEELELTLNPS